MLLSFFFASVFFLTADRLTAQEFISKKGGTWQDVSTWSTAGNCGQNQNPSTGFPPISKNWGCGVSVLIKHHVRYTGDASGFGSGVFSDLSIASGGKLTYTGNVTVDGGGSVPVIQLANNAELHVEGTLTLDRAVSLTVPSGSKLIVNALVIGNNGPVITIEEGGELIVSETTTLRSRSTLNLAGNFQTNNLTFTSGGTINASESSSTTVGGDLTVTNGTMNLGGRSKLVVKGKTDVGQSGTIEFRDSGTGIFAQQVKIPNGATFRVRNSANFRFDEGLDMSGGGKLLLSDQSSGIIVKDVTLPNGEIQTGNNAELNVGGKLTATNGGKVNTMSSSSVFICDYPNSTQLGTYHISKQGNSFYGAGCIPLPVIWESVKATFLVGQQQVQLSWITAAEKNNSHFVVERSVSGLKGFIEVQEVAAVGWSELASEYAFLDSGLPAVKGMVYYRIKQVDFDGKYAYSDVFGVQVDNHKALQGIANLVAFPNPTNGERFRLKFDQPVLAPLSLKATLKSWGGGKQLAADNLDTLSMLLAEEIKLAPKGVCLIEVVIDTQVQYLKVLKH